MQPEMLKKKHLRTADISVQNLKLFVKLSNLIMNSIPVLIKSLISGVRASSKLISDSFWKCFFFEINLAFLTMRYEKPLVGMYFYQIIEFPRSLLLLFCERIISPMKDFRTSSNHFRADYTSRKSPVENTY